MRRPVLLAVSRPATEFAGLLEALREAGERAGWLDLAGAAAPPPPLEEAARCGVLRAVGVGGDRVVTVKPVPGGTVLEDLLREHFLGCRLVLVRGAESLPRLEPAGDGWRLEERGERPVRLATPELVASLRKPSQWRRRRRG